MSSVIVHRLKWFARCVEFRASASTWPTSAEPWSSPGQRGRHGYIHDVKRCHPWSGHAGHHQLSFGRHGGHSDNGHWR